MVFLNSSLYFVGLFLLGMCAFPFYFFLSLILTVLSTFLGYIHLTYLIPELLEMVDENKIAFNPAVEISYLEQSEQRVLLNAMELNDCTPSHAQSIRLKKLSQDGVLNEQTIYDILAEQKPNQQEQYKFKREDIRKYFPKSYTDKQVCDTVIKLLEQWQRRRERDRDSR